MDHVPPASQHDDRLTPTRMMFRDTLRDYLTITKPGIIGGNVISVLGGYFLAAQGQFDAVVFLSALLGLALVIA